MASGEVQHLVSAWQELEASPAHGRPHQVADQGLESGPIARRNVDGVVDGEAGVPPRREQLHTLLGDQLFAQEEGEDLVAEQPLGREGIDAEADAFMRREARQPWIIPEHV